jgi:hypothetical protein
MVEIAHNTVRKYPDEGFDIVSRFVYNTFHSAFDFLQQNAPGHKLSRSLHKIFSVKKEWFLI